MIGSLSIWHWLIVLAALALLFGRGKLSALMGDLGSSLTGFRRGIREGAEALRESESEVCISTEESGCIGQEDNAEALLGLSSEAAPPARLSIELARTEREVEAVVSSDNGHAPFRREGE